MTTKRRSSKSTATRPPEFDDPAAVNAWLAALDHPLKPVLEAIRHTILVADRTVTEGIKWNSPSFYCHGWFATTNLRAKDKIVLVLHHGAKERAESNLSETIDDASGLLTWLAQDRAVVNFSSADDFQYKEAALRKIIQQWVAFQAYLVTLT